jgi:formylglycine-generating enzyme required for sulfatase activity
MCERLPPRAAAAPPTTITPRGEAPLPAMAPFSAEEAQQHQQRWADYLGVPVEYENSIGMKLVLIPPGQFRMGSEHQVTLTSPFYVGKHEVTVDQFKEFVKDSGYQTEAEKGGRGGSVHNPKTGRREDMRDHSWRAPGYSQDETHPVVMVTWNDAVAFCSWLGERTGRTYRLPTEAEWEFTCRAGTTTAWPTGEAQESLRGFANLADQRLTRESVVKASTAPWDDGHAYTAPVGTFRPNGFEIHDIVGNVWEWCRDWYASNYYQRAPREDPPGPASGSDKVIRGGAWNAGPNLAVSDRSQTRHEVTYCTNTMGFRVVCEIEVPLFKPTAEPTVPVQPKPPGAQKKPPADEPASAEMDSALKPLDELENKYAEATRAVESKVAAWDFAAALTALGKVQFEEEELTARLTAWRDGVEHLADLKARIIAGINAADPRLKKSDLMIRGVGGEVAEADEDGITAELPRGKTESLAWRDVGPQAVEKLVEIGEGAQHAEDWLAVAVLALASEDPTSAEKHLEQAQSLGAEIGPYLAPLAAMAFSRARQLLKAERYIEAEALLTNLEAKYAETGWYSANQAAVQAVRAQARAGVYEAEAEKLYVEAAELFRKEQLFDVLPLVGKLKSDYADSQAVTDAARQPSVAELKEAVANLGQFLRVRQDGQGDFTSVQAAIDAAAPNSLIEIQDDGPYNEKITIPEEKRSLTVRGGKGFWPVVTSLGPTRDFRVLVTVDAPAAVFERLVLIHGTPMGRDSFCISASAPDHALTLRRVVLWMAAGQAAVSARRTQRLENCIILAPGYYSSSGVIEDCLLLGQSRAQLSCEIRHCTIAKLTLAIASATVKDSIIGQVSQDENYEGPHRVEHCNIFGAPPAEGAITGRICFNADPQFRDPANLDYRLLPTSPCIGKGSDGGDIGCRYTPEMMEMIQKALELRAKGIIKF